MKPILIAVGGTVAASATAVTLDVNTIILAVINLVGVTITGILALRMKEVHVAVNSSKTVLENKLDDFYKRNVELAKKVAELEENKRGAELAKATAAAPPGLVVMPSMAAVPVPVPVAAAEPLKAPPAGRLDDAIAELTDAAEETVEAAEKTVDQAAKIRKP